MKLSAKSFIWQAQIPGLRPIISLLRSGFITGKFLEPQGSESLSVVVDWDLIEPQVRTTCVPNSRPLLPTHGRTIHILHTVSASFRQDCGKGTTNSDVGYP